MRRALRRPRPREPCGERSSRPPVSVAVEAGSSSCETRADMAEVETSRDGGVLTITLNRPEVLNAFNAAMHRALQAAFKEARDDEVRAVVVTGAGRGFCVGQDLTEFRESAGDIAGRLRGSYHPTILGLRGLEKPVLAAVNGAAAGAGLSLTPPPAPLPPAEPGPPP